MKSRKEERVSLEFHRKRMLVLIIAHSFVKHHSTWQVNVFLSTCVHAAAVLLLLRKDLMNNVSAGEVSTHRSTRNRRQ